MSLRGCGKTKNSMSDLSTASQEITEAAREFHPELFRRKIVVPVCVLLRRCCVMGVVLHDGVMLVLLCWRHTVVFWVSRSCF